MKLEGIFAKRAKEQQGARTDIILKSEKGLEPISTMHEVAKIAGVGHDTVAKVKKIEASASPELIGALQLSSV